MEELTQIEWSISKKQNNGRAFKTNIEDKEHHFAYCFEFDTNTKSRFVRILLIQSPNIKDFRLFYITKYQKESDKNVYFFTGQK